jgi:hypothetical protein
MLTSIKNEHKKEQRRAARTGASSGEFFSDSALLTMPTAASGRPKK